MKFAGTSTGEQKSFEPLAEGRYKLMLVKVTEKTSKQNNPLCELEFQVAGTNRKVFDNLVGIQSCLWKWEQVAIAYGAPQPKKGEQMEFDTASWQGRYCEAQLKIKSFTHNGEQKKKNVIQYYVEPSAPAPFQQQQQPAAAAPATHAAPPPPSPPTEGHVPPPPPGATQTATTIEGDEDEVPF